MDINFTYSCQIPVITELINTNFRTSFLFICVIINMTRTTMPIERRPDCNATNTNVTKN
jgi:hypothetical protein